MGWGWWKLEIYWKHLDYPSLFVPNDGCLLFSSYRLCDPSEREIYKSSPLFGIYYSVEKVGSLKVGDPVYRMVQWWTHEGDMVKGRLCFWTAGPWNHCHVFTFCCFNRWESEQLAVRSSELANALHFQSPLSLVSSHPRFSIPLPLSSKMLRQEPEERREAGPRALKDRNQE